MNTLQKPPSAERAERALLSVILTYPDTHVSRAKSDGLHPELFSETACAILMKVILERAREDEGVDITTLASVMQDSGDLDRMGGPANLMEIAGAANNSQHWDEHLKIVRDRYARRMAKKKVDEISASTQHEDSESILKMLTDATESVRLSMAQSQAFQTAKGAMRKFIDVFNSRLQGGDEVALPTGIKELDALGGGMRPGELWIVCGETSAGKSALAYQMTIPAIEEGKKVLIMTLEMTSDEVMARLMSCRGGIDLGNLTNPQQGDPMGTKKKVQLQMAAFAESNLKISDEPNMTIDFVCAQAEMEAELGGVDLVIVDYIQLLDGGRKSGDSQEQELAYYSRRLKQLAKKLNCPVISPAQVNDDGRLRGSRAIGHDSDVILKIEPNEGVLVGKYRNGEKGGTLPLGLLGQYQRFVTMDFKPRNQYKR